MVKDMYKFKTVFSDIKSIYEGSFENGLEKYQEKCSKFITENQMIDDNFGTICKKCMKYINYLEQKFQREYQKTAQGMLYLFCWLYDKELYKEKYSNNQVDIYKDLIKKFDENEEANLPQIFRSNVNEEHIDQLKKVYDLYYKFDKFKNSKDNGNSCEIVEECVNSYTSYNNNCSGADNVMNTDFCAGVKEFEKYYISYVNEKKICHGSIIYIIFVKNRIVLTTMISILITLIATFILFFRYKFTPPSFCLFTRKKDNQKLKNKINQELYNTTHSYEMSYANSNNSPYNLSYHSMETN